MDTNGVLGDTRDKLNSLSICEEKDRGNAKQGYGRSSDTDSPSCSSDKTAQFKMLIADARQMVTEEKLHDALELYEKALSLCYSDKLANRITKLKAFIKENIQTENPITTEERNSPIKSGRILSSGSENRQASSIATDQEGIFEEEERRFRKLLSTSKELTAQGRIQEALELNKIALTICHSDKLAKRIAKMEEYLGEKDQERSKDHGTDNVSEEQSSREDISTQDSSNDTQQRFTELISAAKMHTHNGEIQEALKKYKTALSLCYSEKLEKRIQKIQEYLDQNNEKDKSSPTEQTAEKDSEGQTSSSRTGSQGELSSGEQERFNKLVTEAKKLTSDGEVRAALEKNKQALKIFYSEKLQKRISKMEAYLAEYENKGESDEEDGGMVHIGNEFYIYKDLANKLYSHQRAGVLWMWGLHQKKKGGILGDDMGLGKTIQVISFLSGLFDMERCHSVLIVMPVSVIVNWEKEFTKWAPGINIEAFHGSSKKEKERALTKVQRRGGVLLTSYGLVITSWEMLSQQNGREYKWDYLILDEGHKIKNPTKTAKAVHQVGAKNRIILTGTPIQNNLRELWALFDFVHQGSLLGTARTFKMEYENPITRARERDATAGERRLGLEMAESLKKIIAPYFLRRTKAEVLKDEKEPQVSNKVPAAKMPSLTRKNDFIVWLYLTETQQRIYSDFLSLDSVKELLMTKKSPLVALNVLKKICDHPRLLSTRACAQLGLDGEDRLDDSDLESEAGFQCAVNQIKNMQDDVLINESGKLIVVVELLDKNKAEGHRTLLFSQSRKMLDIIQQVITNRGHKVMRLDGTVTHLSDRDQRIQKFQTDQSYSVFLLTTQVGGVGLTLTAADRVVIYDPSWNPATDAQAVDRVFRIGQDKNVVIYRLITCGTVEEKIYRRQVFKDSITRQTTGNSKNPYRYFTKQELRELFTLDNSRYSKTQQQLEEMHSGHRNTDSSLDAHVAFLYSLEIFGLSDHDLMFTNEKCDIDYDDDDVGGADVEDGNDYIQHRVQKAQELLKMESELSQDFNDRVSKYPRNIDVGDQAGTRRPVSQPWSNWTMEGMVNISKENDGGSDTGVKKEVKNDEGCIDLTTIHHNSSEEEVIDLSSPVPSPVKVKAEPTVKVEHTDTENSAEKISNHISEDVFPKIKTEKESPGKISESEVYSMKVEPESHSDTDVNDDQLSMTGSDDNKSIPTDPVTDSEDESKSLDDPLSISQTENNIMASNENDAADHETVHSPNVQLSMSGSEQGVTGPGTTENVSNPHLNNSDSDDDKMNNSLSHEKSFVIEEAIQGSNMSQDKNLESEAANNNKTNTPKHSHVQEMSSPKSQTRTKTPKSRRKSVSASPWLKNTPKKGHQDVIEEELLISPDGRHPLISSKRTISSSSDVSPCKSVNLNSTILSVFGESPVPHKLSNRSKVGSHLSSNSNLGMTFIEESPVGDKVSDQVYKTVVENSPGYSANRSDDAVFDSPESKSTSRKSELLNNNSSSVGETDDESSPKKSKSDGRHNVDNSDDDMKEKVPNSDDEDTEEVLDSDREDTNSEINKRRFVKSSDLRAVKHMSDSDQDSDDSLPCLSHKTLQKKRYTVIESDDDEDNDAEDNERSVEQDSDDEMREDDGKPAESAQTRDKMNNQEIISSDEEDNVDSGNREHGNAYVEGSDEEESEDEEGSDMSGFIVDDDDDEEEEEETEEDEEESEEEEDNEKSAFDDLPKKMRAQYQQYMKNGRSLYKSGEYSEALANFLQALEIFPDPALQAMALKCHQKMN